MEELDKKIAEWLGMDRVPRFSRSIGLCFKHIVPKLNSWGWYVNLFQSMPINYWKCHLTSPYSGTAPTITLETLRDRFVECAETPALALCLAVEKLIQGEEDANNR